MGGHDKEVMMNSKCTKKGSKPMTEKHKKVLRKQRKVIMDSLEPKYILDGLLVDGIITPMMKETIMASNERVLQVSTLLDILERRGDAAFYSLIKILRDDYIFLSRALCEDPNSDVTFEPESASISVSEQEGNSLCSKDHPQYRLPAPLNQSNFRKSLTDDEIYDLVGNERLSADDYCEYENQDVEKGGSNVLKSGVITEDTLGCRINKAMRRNSEISMRSGEATGYVLMTNFNVSHCSRTGSIVRTKESAQSNPSSDMAEYADLSFDQVDATLPVEVEQVLFKSGMKVLVDTDTRTSSENPGMIRVFDVKGREFEIPEDCVHVHGEASSKADVYPQPLTTENAKFLLRGLPIGTYLVYYVICPLKRHHSTAELALVTKSGAVKCFKISRYTDGRFGFREDLTFACIEDLLAHHKTSREDLPVSLMRQLSNLDTVSHLLSLLPEDLIIEPDELTFDEKKSGRRRGVYYGSFSKATYKGQSVSVKDGSNADRTLIGMEKAIEEVKIMSVLDHESILTCIGASLVSESKIYIINENIGKGDLRSTLAEEELSELSDSVFLDITKQILSAVSYLHDKYIIHRSLFVRNIFADEELNIKLGGFSRAKKAINGSYKAEGHESLTSPWAAPEVNECGLYSPHSDVWDLALTIIDIYNGGVRDYCKHEKAILSLLLDGSIPKRPERCPRNVFRILQRCLVANCDERPSAHKLLNQIEALDNHGPFYAESALEEHEQVPIDEEGPQVDVEEEITQKKVKKTSKVKSFLFSRKPFGKKEKTAQMRDQCLSDLVKATKM